MEVHIYCLAESAPRQGQLLSGRLVPEFARSKWLDAVQHSASGPPQASFPVVTAVFGTSGATPLDFVVDLSKRSASCVQQQATRCLFDENCGDRDMDVIKILQNALIPRTFIGRLATSALGSAVPSPNT